MKLKRIVAYFIDLIIISMISSLIFMLPIFKTSYKEYNDLSENFAKNYANIILNSGSGDENLEDLVDVSYNIIKTSTPLLIIELAVSFTYFGVICFVWKGQTLGKKLFKLQIVPNEGKELNPSRFMLRQILVSNIIFQAISLFTLILCSKNTYTNITTYIDYMSQLVQFLMLGFVIFRDDERGLHDLIGNTKVISTKENK